MIEKCSSYLCEKSPLLSAFTSENAFFSSSSYVLFIRIAFYHRRKKERRICFNENGELKKNITTLEDKLDNAAPLKTNPTCRNSDPFQNQTILVYRLYSILSY